MGEHQHDSLPDEVIAIIQEIKEELADVRPMSMEDWVDGFLRDANPNHEVAGWLHLSKILRTMTDRHDYDEAKRHECFGILIACFTGSRESVRIRSNSDSLPDDQIDQAIEYFFDGGY